jgi:REP element-mobilizing transposase RayT
MPDHLHWVIDDCAHMSALVRRFKSYTIRRARESGVEGRLWQRSYWDHVIRDSEGLGPTIRYVLANPVRAGLVDSPDDWPWSLRHPDHRPD